MIPIVITYSRGYVVEGSRIRTHFEFFAWICALPESVRVGHDVLVRHAQKTACQLVSEVLDTLRQDPFAKVVLKMKKREIVARAHSTPSGRAFFVVSLPLAVPSPDGSEEDEKNTKDLPEKVKKALTAIFGDAVVRVSGLNEEPGETELSHEWRMCVLRRTRVGQKVENPTSEGPLPAALAYFESLDIGRAIAGDVKNSAETILGENGENDENREGACRGEAGDAAGQWSRKRVARYL